MEQPKTTPDASDQSFVNASLHVYAVGDYYWFIAPNEMAALEDYTILTEDDDTQIDEVVRLTDSDLDALRYFDDIYSRTGDRSFREQVEKLKAEGDWEPGVFAISGSIV